jgi:hypothetical protein
MRTLSQDERKAFAEEGYVVVPQVVPRNLIDDARQEIKRLVTQNPPPSGHKGFHFYFLNDLPRRLLALLTESPAKDVAESLIAPNKLAMPEQVQVSLIIPPWAHKPGGPHIDGLTPPEKDGRPGTFSMLAGIFLTDQSSEDMGNLYVWPRSHCSCADYFREHGPDALRICAPYPPVSLGAPRQVLGQTGDLLLAHYMLGHNMGGNKSEITREVVYFRLRRENHREHWRRFVQDELFEVVPV